MTVLTADLCARAIVAAARAYGDPPLRFVSAGTSGRRALTAAALGIAAACDIHRATACRVLGIARTAAYKAAGSEVAEVRVAIAAAREAAERELAARKDGGVTLPPPPVTVNRGTWRAPPPLSDEMRAALDAAAASAVAASRAKCAKIPPPGPAHQVVKVGVKLPFVPVANRVADDPKPPPQPAHGKPRVLTAGAVRREVLARLRGDPATVPDLAAELGLGEAQVREAVRTLSEARDIVGSAVTAEGWRQQYWKAVESGDGADD